MQVDALPRLKAATHPTVDFATHADDAAIWRAQSPPTSVSKEAQDANSPHPTVTLNEGLGVAPMPIFPPEFWNGPVRWSISNIESTMRFQEADESVVPA